MNEIFTIFFTRYILKVFQIENHEFIGSGLTERFPVYTIKIIKNHNLTFYFRFLGKEIDFPCRKKATKNELKIQH